MRYKTTYIMACALILGYFLTQAMHESTTSTDFSLPSPEEFSTVTEQVEDFSLKATSLTAQMQKLYNSFKNTRQKALINIVESFSSSKRWLTSGQLRPWENIGRFMPFVQKLRIQPGDIIHIFGDIHGDGKALLEGLKKLNADGVLNNQWKIQEKHHLIFLGDYTDRGLQGIETWYTLLKLREANSDPESVIILRGNHEEAELNSEYSRISQNGYFAELQKKFGLDCYTNEQAQKKIYTYLSTHLYNFLPVALYLVCEQDTVLCVHGGLELGFDPKPLLTETDPQKIFMPLGKLNRATQANSLSTLAQRELKQDSLVVTIDDFMPTETFDLHFLWNDFTSIKQTLQSERGESSWTMGDNLTRELLNRDNIRCVFRGHQHDLAFNQPEENFGFYSFPSGLIHTIISFGQILGYNNVCSQYSFVKIAPGKTFSEWKAWHMRDGQEYPINLQIQKNSLEEPLPEEDHKSNKPSQTILKNSAVIDEILASLNKQTKNPQPRTTVPEPSKIDQENNNLKN